LDQSIGRCGDQTSFAGSLNLGTITYFGTYSISEADSGIAVYVEGSSFPNWSSRVQKRFVAITGDQLTLTVRSPGGDVVDVIWKWSK
jgi:Lipocalin-like domain